MSRGDRGAGGPEVHFEGGAVSIGAAPRRPGSRPLARRYDPRIGRGGRRRGENAGRTLPHKDVVHEMVLLGHWRGAAKRFRLPASSEGGLADAVIVQAAGPVLAAAKAN